VRAQFPLNVPLFSHNNPNDGIFFLMSKKSRARKNFRNNLKNRIARPDEAVNDAAAIALSKARRSQFPPGDPFLSMFDWLEGHVDRNIHFITVLSGGTVGSFASDNWAWMIHFASGIHNSENTVITCRRFEEGPMAQGGFPYKTVTNALFRKGAWFGISEEEVLYSQTTDFATGKSIPLEDGVLPADFCETYPDAPATPVSSLAP